MTSSEIAFTAAQGSNDPIPLLFGNVASVIACPSKKEFASAFHVSPSAACRWEESQRIPLRYLAPLLSVMSWDTLCGPGLASSHHVGRGYTRIESLACRGPDAPGPVLLQFRSEIDEVMERIRVIVGSTGYKEIGHGVSVDRNQVATWVKRRKIPDPIYHRIAKRYTVSLSWLLTGVGERPQAVEPRAQPPAAIRQTGANHQTW